MAVVALGLLVLVLLLWAANAFSRASVGTVKALLAWIGALGGLSLATLLLLTGRGGLALSGLVFAGPALWRWWQAHAAQPKLRSGPRAAPTSFMNSGGGAGSARPARAGLRGRDSRGLVAADAGGPPR